MRFVTTTTLVLLGLTMFGLSWVQAEQVSGVPSNFEVELPSELVWWANAANEQAPPLLTAQRELEIARSHYRASMAEVQGSSLGLEAPVEVNHKGIGSSVTLSWRQAHDATQVTANFGVSEAYKWSEEIQVLPVIRLTVTHALGSDASARVSRHDYVLRSAEVRFLAARRSWTQELIKAYGAVELAKQDAAIADKRLNLARQELEVARMRGADGTASTKALHDAEQNVMRREASAAVAALNVERALHELRAVVGPVGTDVATTLPTQRASHQITVAPAADNEAAWVAMALEQREDVRLAAQAVLVAEAELREARRRAGLSGQLRGGVAFPDSPDADPTLGWYVGAAFSLPLHDTASSEAITQAQLRLEQALADQEELLCKVRTEVELAYKESELTTRSWVQASEAAAYAAHTLKVAQEALQAGIGTELDVTEAEIAILEAERNVLAAYYDMVTRRVALWHRVGGDVAW